MSQRKIDLDELLRRIEACEERGARAVNMGDPPWNQGYWQGRADGLNKVYRFLTTGEWET